LNRDGSRLILAVSDGAVTPQTMSRSLARHGAYTAMKLDSGSSSALFYNGSVLKASRPVAEALLVLPHNPQLNASPVQGKVGDSVTVAGSGFTPNRAALSHLRKPDGSEFSKLLTFNGNGTLTSLATVSLGGVIHSGVAGSGSYTVNANCTGTLTFNGSGLTFDLFISPNGSTFHMIETISNTVLAGQVRRVPQ
jgi:hypothetical protein